MPYLAVAGGPYIFIYKNLKGTFKFLIPPIDPNKDEINIWNELKDSKIEHQAAINRLQDLNAQRMDLSTRTYELLSLASDQAKIRYIEERKMNPVIISNFVVCMTTIKKVSGDDMSTPSQIVVGTECGLVYVIDHSGSKIIAKFRIPNIPFQIAALGAYDVDYRLHIAGRNNTIYTIKNGEVTSALITVTNNIVGLIRTDKSIIVGTMDACYHSYHPQGKKNFTIKLPAHITCMEYFDCSRTKNFRGTTIALKNGEVRLYNEKNLIHLFRYPENIFGIKFGKFGREDETLILITESGSLIVKVLQRNVNFDVKLN